MVNLGTGNCLAINMTVLPHSSGQKLYVDTCYIDLTKALLRYDILDRLLTTGTLVVMLLGYSLDIDPAYIRATNSSKSASESCGPGEASG
jgi:hypothetical protein